VKPELSSTSTSLLGSHLVDNPTDRQLYIACPSCQSDCFDSGMSDQVK